MKSLMRRIIRTLSRVKVYALVGKSGTGKSFRARLVAEKHHIPLIIDDGLLIRYGRIVAGHSAKNEPNYLAAVRMALFEDSDHRRDVGLALVKERFSKILLVGTSERMVQRITERLHLPPVSRLIAIEDIATREEIEKALTSRSQGHHVIPVPFIEIKKDYGHLWSDSIRVFFAKTFFRFYPKSFEKSVVRPDFQRKRAPGDHIAITPTALKQMIVHCVDEYDHNIVVKKITVKPTGSSYKILLSLQVPYGVQLAGNLHQLQSYIRDHILRYTGLILNEVFISIAKVI